MSLKSYLQTKNGQRNVRAVGFFVAFYCGLVVFTAFSQERLIYLPRAKDFNDCPAVTTFGLVPQEFNGTRFYGPTAMSSSSRLVVIYHGNAGAACDRAFYLPYVENAEANAILVEYAGYSNDVRSPSHTAIKQDVVNIINLLKTNDVTEVIVIGESIGTGPAILHASQLPPKHLVLITPFTDLAALAKYHYWYFPTSLLVNNAFNNTRTLAQYPGQRTLIHGTDDEIVPFFMSRSLAAITPSKTTLMPLENARHNNLYSHPEFADALSEALRP